MKFIRLSATIVAVAAMIASSNMVQAANVVETAASNRNFSTLVAAVKAAGLVDELATASPITVFAPTNAAFAKLPKKTLSDLLKQENRDKLRAILAYHVVPAKILAKDVPHQPTRVKTLNGGPVRTVRRGSKVKVNNANVVIANIVTDNGIVHAIDTVLIPGKLH